MSDYIERGAARVAVYGRIKTQEVCDVINDLNAIPAADVERVVLTERKEKAYHIDGEDSVWIVCGNRDASQFAGLGNAQRCYSCGAHFMAHMDRSGDV